MKDMKENDVLDEVVLLSEDGEETRFSHLLTFLYEGERYVALEPMAEEPAAENEYGEEEAEVVILRIAHGEDGDVYLPVDNDVLLEEAFGRFLELMDEIEEEEE